MQLFLLIQIGVLALIELKVDLKSALNPQVIIQKINIFVWSVEIAAATQAHCRRVAKNMASNSFTVDSILTNIHCTFCNNYIELLAAVYGLKRLLANTPEVCRKYSFNYFQIYKNERILNEFFPAGSFDCDRFIFVSFSVDWFWSEFSSNDLWNLNGTTADGSKASVCGNLFQ